MARPIIEASQKNRDNLLHILLYEKYIEYKKTHIELKIRLEENNPDNPTVYYSKFLTFDEWLEKILEEF